jgi:hypothetical protein
MNLLMSAHEMRNYQKANKVNKSTHICAQILNEVRSQIDRGNLASKSQAIVDLTKLFGDNPPCNEEMFSATKVAFEILHNLGFDIKYSCSVQDNIAKGYLTISW